MSGDIGLSGVADDADQEQWYQFVMAALGDQGLDRTEIEKVWIWLISPTLAQLVADLTRYKADESVLNQARANDTLCRRDGV